MKIHEYQAKQLLAVAGVPVQLALHSAANVAWQDALQWALSLLELHCAVHWAFALALQLALQSNWAGCTLQSASQVVSQLAVQLTDGTFGHEPSHITSRSAAHAASKLTGVQLAVQPPLTSVSHMACASTSILPHELRSARAMEVDKSGNAHSAAAKAPKAKEFFIEPSPISR